MPGFVSPVELLLLAVVALVVFGPKKLPEMARTLGKGLRSFKESLSGITESLDADPAPHAPSALGQPAPQAAHSRDDLDDALTVG